ncbi:SDR family oxidoreductase [Nocardiopsis sp. FIRDI 009]|uniref:SDR family oxidoreductase n=1 Tax=Nocardiopsis sp. FIRDI 009 TaxID=714197 RepID=UPI000E2267E9|nr:SDR family oxidoreductase [Nocardiopsis sp. FIRDI 009]
MSRDPRCALITGAGRRVGAYLARSLARRGYALHLHARTSALGPLAFELREEFGTPVFTHHLDLEDTVRVQDWARDLRDTRFPPTLLVNNASPFPSGHSVTEIEHLERGLRVHLLAPTLLLDVLSRNGGHVVNMLDARLPLTDGLRPGYELSKHALAALTLMAAKRLAPRVRVNAIAPGLLLPPPGHDAEALGVLARRRGPLRRPAHLEDVASALFFLEGAASVTGQVIHVDAGEHLGAPLYE